MLGAPGRDSGLALDDVPIVDASRWRSHWQLLRGRVGSYKLRYGQPYDPLATVDELEAETLPGTRTDAALELAIVSRGQAVVETGDWIARQRSSLAAARAMLARGAWPTGAFPGERLA
jgi:hypothetical protein